MIDDAFAGRTWDLLTKSIVEAGTENFRGRDLANLCMYISQSQHVSEEFWAVLIQRFNTYRGDFSMRDYVMIYNALKKARRELNDAVLVEQLDQMVGEDDVEVLDWHVISMLLSTLNMIQDPAVHNSQVSASLWEKIAQVISASLRKNARTTAEKKGKLNLHTLLMVTRQLVQLGGITPKTDPSLWLEISETIVKQRDEFVTQSKPKMKGAVLDLLKTYIHIYYDLSFSGNLTL